MIENETVATEVVVTPVETTPEVIPAPKEETAGEVLAIPEVATLEETVSLAKFMKAKNRNKELEDELDTLRNKPNPTAKQVSTDLKAIADEYGVDESFIEKLSETFEARADAKTEAKLQPLREKERQEKIETNFTGAFDRAMAQLPEYSQIVNRNVIKTLSLDPVNKNKTFVQIIEEAYGTAVTGKKTTERATPRVASVGGDLDYNRAKSDNDYFKEVMADPILKKQYNDKLFSTL